jgi:hypothetical protein
MVKSLREQIESSSYQVAYDEIASAALSAAGVKKDFIHHSWNHLYPVDLEALLVHEFRACQFCMNWPVSSARPFQAVICCCWHSSVEQKEATAGRSQP